MADKLTIAIEIGVPAPGWDSYVNNVLVEWEQQFGGEGPRLVEADEPAGTVRMAPRK